MLSTQLLYRRVLKCKYLCSTCSVKKKVKSGYRCTPVDVVSCFCLFTLVDHFCALGYESLSPPRTAAVAAPVWQDRTIASSKLRLLEYSAFLETQKDRETVWAAASLHKLSKDWTLAYVTVLLPLCRINTFLYTSARRIPVTTTQCWNP